MPYPSGRSCGEAGVAPLGVDAGFHVSAFEAGQFLLDDRGVELA